MTTSHLVLKFRAPDRPGIIASIAPLVAAQGCDIREAAVYGDPDTGSFFSRIALISPLDRDALRLSIIARFGAAVNQGR